MGYIVIGVIILVVMYLLGKKNASGVGVNAAVTNKVITNAEAPSSNEKAELLGVLKGSFQPSENTDDALDRISQTLNVFYKNHYQSSDEILEITKAINLSDDSIKKEVEIRKNINKYYKDRSEKQSKCIAMHFCLEHVKHQLQHPDIEWKNFTGLQKLHSNLKAIEYFDSLVDLMLIVHETFPNSPKSESLQKDIQRVFELWNSQQIALENYKVAVGEFSTLKSASDKHFSINTIIKYLARRYKFNPTFKEELESWCVQDTELYIDFLKQFNEHNLFTIKQQMAFYDNESLKEEKLAEISFERVKKHKNYNVPRLPSLDVLFELYKEDADKQRLDWIEGVAEHIKYYDE